jgi:3-oxoadipate enol-lactonase
MMRWRAQAGSLGGLLPKVTCSTLVTWGGHDTFSKPADGRRMQSLLPDSEYHELPECEHLPSLEQPEAVANIATKWLDAISS